jgi:repressor LexA
MPRPGEQDLVQEHLEIRLFFAYEGRVVTRRQRQVLDFVQTYLRRHGYAPSLEEIGRHLGMASLATVHKHLTRLESRGVIRRRAHQSRSVEVLDRPESGGTTSVPLLGRVAAGRPIEPVETAESVALPEDLLGKGETFALRVVGDSMIGDGILDGDVVVVESRPDAPNGATVVAVVRGEATVKRFYRRRGRIHLIPANERVEPIVASDDDVQVRGVVIGLLRRYR